MKYRQEVAGRWIWPTRNGYKMMCCDCKLVHVLDFKTVSYGRGRKVMFRAFRDNRSTAAARRKKS